VGAVLFEWSLCDLTLSPYSKIFKQLFDGSVEFSRGSNFVVLSYTGSMIDRDAGR
jgi:hypothetical protein